jgi:MerR family transcriptional regulator, redox-sensitive transcriptional activator SoxR
MDDASLTIGQVAEQSGLNVSALRFYEARGLLQEAPRVSGQRRYTPDILNRLGVIDVAKRAGFSLEDIRLLLDANDAGSPAHARLQELAERKLPEVAELISRAQAVQRWLEMARNCGCESLDICGLFTGSADLGGATLRHDRHDPARSRAAALEA